MLTGRARQRCTRRTLRLFMARSAAFMRKALLMCIVVTVREWLRREVAVTARALGLPIRGSIPCMPWAAWDMAWLGLAMADVAGKAWNASGPVERLCGFN